MSEAVVVPYLRDPTWESHDDLLAHLRRAFAEAGGEPVGAAVDVRSVDELTEDDLAAIEVAIVDGPTAAQLAALPALRWVHSTWAGVEQLLEVLPADVAVARMVDPVLTHTMAEAVLAWTLYLHREMPRYARQQAERVWDPTPARRTSAECRVGLLGLGELGAAAATMLATHGFDVAGWSRTAKSVDGVRCHHGDRGFVDLLERSDIVINLLPDTADTVGLLGASAFARLPRGASVVNFGRGSTVDDDALLAALDAEHVDHAVLDVFVTEPLPDEHPYWTHPRVTVLPHITGPTNFATAADIVAANVTRWLRTGELPDDVLVDRDRGY